MPTPRMTTNTKPAKSASRHNDERTLNYMKDQLIACLIIVVFLCGSALSAAVTSYYWRSQRNTKQPIAVEDLEKGAL